MCALILALVGGIGLVASAQAAPRAPNSLEPLPTCRARNGRLLQTTPPHYPVSPLPHIEPVSGGCGWVGTELLERPMGKFAPGSLRSELVW
jgi:hypothetical protein